MNIKTAGQCGSGIRLLMGLFSFRHTVRCVFEIIFKLLKCKR